MAEMCLGQTCLSWAQKQIAKTSAAAQSFASLHSGVCGRVLVQERIVAGRDLSRCWVCVRIVSSVIDLGHWVTTGPNHQKDRLWLPRKDETVTGRQKVRWEKAMYVVVVLWTRYCEL